VNVPVPTPQEMLVAAYLANLTPTEAFQLAIGHEDSSAILSDRLAPGEDRVGRVRSMDLSARAGREVEVREALEMTVPTAGAAAKRVLSERIGVDRTGLLALMEGKTKPWPWTDAALAHVLGRDIVEWWNLERCIDDPVFLDGLTRAFPEIGRETGQPCGTPKDPEGDRRNDRGFEFEPFSKPLLLGECLRDGYVGKSLVVRQADLAFRIHFHVRRAQGERMRTLEAKDAPWIEASMCFVDKDTLMERGGIRTTVAGDWDDMKKKLLTGFKAIDLMPVVGMRVSRF
jgi:hypothetical protein